MIPTDSKLVAVDTESTGLSTWQGDLPYAFSFCDSDGNTEIISFVVNPFTRIPDYTKPGMDRLRILLGDPDCSYVFWNAKHDIRMIEEIGLLVRGKIEEGTFAAHTCKSNEMSFELKKIAKRYCGIDDSDEKELKKATTKLRNKAKKLGWNIIKSGEQGATERDYWLCQHASTLLGPVEGKRVSKLVEKYAITDAERTIILWLFYSDQLDKLGTRGIYDFEMRLWRHTYAMETRGVHVDRRQCMAGARHCKAVIKETEVAIIDATWPGFNSSSFPQKYELFINRLGLEPLVYKNNDKARPTLDKEFLDFHAKNNPVCGLIVKNSEAAKALGTYFYAYLSLMDDKNIIHANFRQIGPRTSRFSCSNPNLQNVPKRAEDGSILLTVRAPFGPRPGYVWYLFDFKQIEARIFAENANETAMLRAFLENLDVYQMLADECGEQFGIDITRDDAKIIFLGRLYGLGKRKLANNLGTDLDSAKRLLANYNATFPASAEYSAEMISYASNHGEVRTRYGQRIPVMRQFAYTQAVNSVIQPEAAQLMKHAMLRACEFLERIGYGWLVLTIHDELVFEFPIDHRPISVLKELKSIIEDNEGMYTKVATPVDVKKVTQSWLKPVGVQW